jgi:polyribonucleotide nucleotidyltransferase
MNDEISKPREDEKSNNPVIKNFEVQIAQRAKLIGMGGINLKRIYSKTGVTISPIDESNFSMFAPNKNALEEAEEIIKSYLETPVSIKIHNFNDC